MCLKELLSKIGEALISALPITAIVYLMSLTPIFNFHLNHSIGIIGGADGPTAIFVSTPEGYFEQQIIIAAILFIMGLLGYWALTHIKRK